MDTNEDFQSITEKRETSRYALHCEFIASVRKSYTLSDHDEKGPRILKTKIGPPHKSILRWVYVAPFMRSHSRRLSLHWELQTNERRKQYVKPRFAERWKFTISC